MSTFTFYQETLGVIVFSLYAHSEAAFVSFCPGKAVSYLRTVRHEKEENEQAKDRRSVNGEESSVNES